jgi:hypothetical protein
MIFDFWILTTAEPADLPAILKKKKFSTINCSWPVLAIVQIITSSYLIFSKTLRNKSVYLPDSDNAKKLCIHQAANAPVKSVTAVSALATLHRSKSSWPGVIASGGGKNWFFSKSVYCFPLLQHLKIIEI